MDPFAWPPRAGRGLPHLSAASGGIVNGSDHFGHNGTELHGSQQQQQQQRQQQQQQHVFQHASHLVGGPASSSAASFSSGASPYPSPLVPGERGLAAPSAFGISGGGPSTLPPVREDAPFTSPPLSSGGMASMTDSRLGSAGGGGVGGFRPSNGSSSNGFGDLVASAFGTGSIGDIWGATSGLATPYDPAFNAGGGGGQAGPPPSTASLIAARPYTANAASALVFMSQSGSADGPHDPTPSNGSHGPEPMGSPVFAADAMLQQVVTQGGSGGPYADLPPSAIPDQSYGRPGSSHASVAASSGQQLAPGGRPMSAQHDPQQFAYAAAAAYPPTTSRTSFAMENLSLQSLSSGGSDQAFASPYLPQQQQQQQRAAPNYHQAPAQALQYGTAPPTGGRRSSISQQGNRPTSQGGPDRRPLHQQQQNLQHGPGSSFTNGVSSGSGLAYIPGYGEPSQQQQHGRSSSIAHRAAHPYSRPAHSSMSAASTAATLAGWNGGIDGGAGGDFAQLYQQQAGLRPQTSDGVPLSFYGADWGVPAAAVFGSSAGIQPSSYAPLGMYNSNRAPAAAVSSRPSTSYAAQAPSMLDPPGSIRQRQQQQQQPAFDPRELQPALAAAGRPANNSSHSSIAPPSLSAGLFYPPPTVLQPPPLPPAAQAAGRRRANSAAVPRTTAPVKSKPKAAPAPKAAEGDSDPDDDSGPPAEREISAVTGRPKRPRRKFEEVERNYVCNFEECGKAYGTLNHLNAHVLSQNHGPKRLPAEFRDLRKLWRRQRRERAAAEASKSGKGAAGKGKRKPAAPAATGKRRKSSAEGAPENQEAAMNSASDDEDGAGPTGRGRRESMASQASTGGAGGEDDDDDDGSSADEDDDDNPLTGATSTPGLNGLGSADGQRFSSPAFVSAGPTPPTFSGHGSGSAGGNSLGYGNAYYNLDIPSFAGGPAGLAAQPALPVADSGPNPFADWSFSASLGSGGNAGPGTAAPTTLPPGSCSTTGGASHSGQAHLLQGPAYLAPTPGLYDAVSLDFGSGPPSEPSTSTAGTPRLGHY